IFDDWGDNINVTYGYYDDSDNGGLNDINKFFAGYENSIGTIIHFLLPPQQWPLFYFGWNDGTVIESGYQAASDNYFIYTTVNSPFDGQHPVSGNRRFGIYPDNVNGGYCLY